MASVEKFEDLEAWQRARNLAKEIYATSSTGGFAKDFVLRDQIRGAAVSVVSNIAEGFERGGNQEFLQFLSVAKGSVGEVRAQLYVALDQGYVDRAAFDHLHGLAVEVSGKLGGLMAYLKASGMKGSKYKVDEPGTGNPDLGTLNPEPGTLNPEHGTLNPELGTLNPELGTRNPELGTWNMEPGTGNPELGTLNPEPGTANPEPGAQNSELGTRNPEPGTPPRQGGFSIVTAVFLVVVLALLGAFIVSVTGLQQSSQQLDVQGVRAYQAARAGIEWGAFQVLDPNNTLNAASCTAPVPTMPACPGIGGTTDLPALAGSLSPFTVTVRCTLTTPDALNGNRSTTEGNRSIWVYQVTADACNQPTGSSCPNTGTPTSGYVSRQITAVLSKCKDPTAAAPRCACG